MPRMIEWIGHASVFQNPVVEYNLARGAIAPGALKVLRLVARRRIYRPENSHVRRELRPDSPEGLSKFYWWGPDEKQMDRLKRGGRLTPAEEEACYVQAVTDNDARIILSDPNLKTEFIDVTEIGAHGPAGTFKGLLVPPTGEIQIVAEDELSSIRQLTRELQDLSS
jgi:hypothetical protein